MFPFKTWCMIYLKSFEKGSYYLKMWASQYQSEGGGAARLHKLPLSEWSTGGTESVVKKPTKLSFRSLYSDYKI